MNFKTGIVGIGFMGWIHYLAYQKVDCPSLSAIVSRDAKKRSGDWRGIQGNFGPPGEQVNLDGVQAYESLDQLLADDSITLVDICLPPYAHVEAVTKSLQAGKHVLCEKPITLTAAEADKLVHIADKAGCKLLVGHVLPFMPEFDFLVSAVRDGRYGKLQSADFRRVIGPVDWNPDFYRADRVGGALVDLHVHDAHLIRLLFGMPTAVTTTGSRSGDTAKFATSVMRFEDPSRFVSVTGGVTDTPGRTFSHSYEAQFENAVVNFSAEIMTDGIHATPLKVMHRDGRVETPSLGDGDPVAAFEQEMRAVAAVLQGRREEPILEGALAADALRICEMEDRSMTTGMTITG